MKKLVIIMFFLFYLLPSNSVFARCHGHYHYYSTPVYLVKSDYFENEQVFKDCKNHYLLTRTTVNFYSNGARRTFNSYTVFNNDGSVLIADCTDIHHIIYNTQHYFLFQKGGLYYIANSKGEIFAKRDYTRMKEILDNRILVRVNKKYGIIDLKENVVLPIKYKTFKKAVNNIFLTKLNGYWGIVNSKGEIVQKNEYEKIKPLYETLVLKKYGKYGLVNSEGKMIVETNNDKIKELGGYILVKKDSFYQVYSSEGILISDKKYKKIRIERNVLEGKEQGKDFTTIIDKI